MKNIFLAVLFVLTGFTFLGGCETDKFHPCEKSYVEPTQVQFGKEGISIQLQNESFFTSTLYSDSKGFYFTDFKRQGNCPEGKWECQVCHYCNPHYTLYCGICWN